MARAADAPVAPFGATRAGVTALVPEAKLVPGDGPLVAGQYGVTEAQVDAWVDELSESVAMTLDGWERLSVVDTLAADGTTILVVSDRERFLGSARTLVHNGAASYLEAARHPERAAVNDTSYAAVLWARYTDGLDRLAAWLLRRLEDPDADVTPEPDLHAGPLHNFPTPLIGDGLRF